MSADPNEMRFQARVLRQEASEFDDVAASLRSALTTDAMVGPAADELRERLIQRASALNGAANEVLAMAANLEQSAAQVEMEQRSALGG